MDPVSLTHREPDLAKLFPIGKVVKATGVSRATVLRMEERGLLSPAHVSKSGRRLYDTYNLSRIMEVQRLNHMGFSNDEIRHYFSSSADSESMLHMVEKRLRILQETYVEMRLRAAKEELSETRIEHLQARDYYVERAVCSTPQEKNDLAYHAYRHCAEKGYQLGTGPLVLVHEHPSHLSKGFPAEPYTICSCTPVEPGQVGPEIERLEETDAAVKLWAGRLEDMEEALVSLAEDTRERGLIPSDYLRIIWIVGPYVGRELTPQNYRAKIVQPVRSGT